MNGYKNFLASFFRRVIYFPRFLFLSLYRFSGKLFFSMIGLFVSVIILTLGLGFEKSVRTAYQVRFLGKLPISELIISKRAKKKKIYENLGILGFFKTQPEGLSYKDYKRIKAIEGVKIKGVLLPLRAPVTLRASLLGRSLRSDVVLTGVSKSLIWKALPKNFTFKVKNNLYPIIIPKYILNAYNTFANVNSLPMLSPANLRGVNLRLYLGESSFKIISKPKDEIRISRGIIVGSTDLSHVNGLLIPLKSAYKLNKEFFADYKSIYSTIYARAAHPSQVDKLAGKIKRLGYQVVSQADISRKANEAVRGVRYILYSMVAVLLFFTGLSIFNGFVSIIERKKNELLMFRIFGASKIWIVFFLLIQVFILSFFYSLLGIFSANWLMKIGNQKFPEMVKKIGISLETVFIIPEKLFIPILFLSVGFSLLVALIPAILAAIQPMSKSLDSNN